MRRTSIIATIALLTTTAPARTAGTIISAVGATVDTGGTGAGTDIANSYDQRGLNTKYVSGVTDFDTYLAGKPTHSIYYINSEWYAAEPGPAVVTYDLGSLKSIGSIAFWNEEFDGPTAFSLLYSIDGSDFTSLGLYHPTDNRISYDYGADRFDFGPVSARYFRLSMDNCPGGNCAIGEIAFDSLGEIGGAVPEPASWAMMIFGFCLAGAALRRRTPLAA